ncbi:MAG: glycosyltransferase family 4 protein [Candidatus Sungbacteria bacterium]|nr:glycosyltransferase family 4 protein [Candidatus Sungbacteria bacterium]
MRLLIVTHALDARDTNLGFFHEWVRRFSETFEEVFVIAQRIGSVDLPSNVFVESSGKERGAGRFMRFSRFWAAERRFISRTDAVFVHMSPLYAILAWPMARFYGRPLYFWYVHGSVTFLLRAAERLVKRVFTASPESFRIPSKKTIVVGHGVDTDVYAPGTRENRGILTIRTLGRISRSKNLHILVKSAVLLKKTKPSGWGLSIIGDPPDEEGKVYLKELLSLSEKEGVTGEVIFHRGVPHSETPKLYRDTDIFVNLSETGSIDKAVLEAMSSGCSIVSSNEAFFSVLPESSLVRELTPENVAGAILKAWDESRPRMDMRRVVEKRFNLRSLIKNISETIKKDQSEA